MEINIDLGKVGLTSGGAWESETRYERLTLVTRNNKAYVSVRDSQGVDPDSEGQSAWMFLFASGSGGGSDSGGGESGGNTIVQGDTISVAYYPGDGKLYWKKNGQWLLDPDGNMVPVASSSSSSPDTPSSGGGDFGIEARYSSIASPGNPSDNPSYWDMTSFSTTIWMAIRIKSNGVWGAWNVMSVRGKDGKDGKDGTDGADATAISIKGSFDDPANLPTSGLTVGDGYLYVGETFTDGNDKTWTTGHLFVWDGDSWEDVGQIQGPAGVDGTDATQYYIHVAFSDDGGRTLTNSGTGTTPGRYFGICVSTSASRPLTASSYAPWVPCKGEDGFGYEFIYKLTTDANAPAVPSGEDVDEYVPAGWDDDQSDVTETNRYCWQCYRVKKDGHWNAYRGSPVNEGYATLVARWGRDGIDGSDGTTPTAHFKSLVFTRSNSTPDTPSGGSYESPIPEDRDQSYNLIWSDGIPSGSEKVWCSTNIFHSDNTAEGWTEPREMTDTDTYDVEFARMQTSDARPAPPSESNRHGGNGTQIWFDPELDSSEDFTNMYWRAERECKNGVWGNWVIVRIKGEKGEDGTAVSILGSLDDVTQLPDSNNTTGDAYLINGDLYVWDGDSWVNAGQIQGPPGDSGHSPILHIKYATRVGNTYVFTANNGETPGDYIGIYWDYTVADSTNVDSYTWSYAKGADGFGYEYIFTRTSEKTAPPVPTDTTNPSTGKTFQDDDFVPAGWTDDAPDLTEDYRFRWKCWRKKTDGLWDAFQGSSSNPGYAIFDGNYAQDGQQGVGISSVTEFYQISADGVTPPNSWSTNVVTPTKQKKFLWNYELIQYSNGDSISTPPCVIGVFGEGRGIASVTEKYLATTLSSGITRNTSGWTTTVQTISSTKPYLWNYEIIAFDDGTTSETEPVIIGHFGADGSPGSSGNGIDHVDEFYAASSDPAIAPSAWGIANTIPADFGTDKPYLWNKETVYYTNGQHVDTPPCIIGVYGTDGEDGRGIVRIDEYYLASSNASEQNDLDENGNSVLGWTKESVNIPQISEDKPYLYNLERIIFSDGTYQDTYPVIIGIYTISALSTYAYLKAVFGEDHVTGQQGALLQSLLGVIDDQERCVAMINASVIGKDSVHGKLMIAAGMDNVSAPGTAKFKVYEDGHVEMIDCKVQGEIVATKLTLADESAGTKVTIGANTFQIGSVKQSVPMTGITQNFTSTSGSSVTTTKLGTLVVPSSGGTRLFIPSFNLKFQPLNSGSNMSLSKVFFRIYLTRSNGLPVMIDGGDAISPSDIVDEIENDFNDTDWMYVGGSGTSNTSENTPQYALSESLTPGETFDVYIKYYWDYAPQDSGTAKFTLSSGDPATITIQPATQGLNIGGNGFQMSLGDGFFLSAVNNNGNKEIFLSARCDDGTDAWISLSSRGIYIRNKGDNTERKL